MNVKDMTDYLCDMLAQASTPAKVRESANYQFMLALANKIMEKYDEFSASTANHIATSVEVDLPLNFHREYPEEFDRLVDAFATALIGIYTTLLEDFNDEAYDFFIKNVSKMSIKLEA
jgi:hypothetical protein